MCWTETERCCAKVAEHQQVGHARSIRRDTSLPDCHGSGAAFALDSRLLSDFGHQVIVANARQVKLISAARRKNDKLDARTLARLARVDPQLLRPLRHRSEQAQMDLMQIRVRAELVEMRTRR